MTVKTQTDAGAGPEPRDHHRCALLHSPFSPVWRRPKFKRESARRRPASPSLSRDRAAAHPLTGRRRPVPWRPLVVVSLVYVGACRLFELGVLLARGDRSKESEILLRNP